MQLKCLIFDVKKFIFCKKCFRGRVRERELVAAGCRARGAWCGAGVGCGAGTGHEMAVVGGEYRRGGSVLVLKLR